MKKFKTIRDRFDVYCEVLGIGDMAVEQRIEVEMAFYGGCVSVFTAIGESKNAAEIKRLAKEVRDHCDKKTQEGKAHRGELN